MQVIHVDLVKVPVRQYQKLNRWSQAKRSTMKQKAPTWVRPNVQPKSKGIQWSVITFPVYVYIKMMTIIYMESKEVKKNERNIYTGKEEQISAMAIPTNHVKNVTTTHPHIKLAGPAYRKLGPYRGVPVKTAMLENVIASVLNRLCRTN